MGHSCTQLKRGAELQRGEVATCHAQAALAEVDSLLAGAVGGVRGVVRRHVADAGLRGRLPR